MSKNIINTFFRQIPQRPITCTLLTAKRAYEANHPGYSFPVREAMKVVDGHPRHLAHGIWAMMYEGKRYFVIPISNFLEHGSSPWNV